MSPETVRYHPPEEYKDTEFPVYYAGVFLAVYGFYDIPGDRACFHNHRI